MILYNHQLIDKEFHKDIKKSHHKRKDGSYKETAICDDIFTFDIEVTSAWIKEGKIIGYEPGHDSEYWNSLTPLALPYIWQFSFNEEVYYGRELGGFLNVLKDLPTDRHIIIWVHNLSYEFHFLINFLHVKNIFARTPHKPMKCIFEEFPNIEFRCSYILTRLSLATWGEQVGLPKMIGDLDYEIIRTPLTPLTEKEMGYCERDCQVVYRGILDYLKRYGHLKDIPLTQTGTVRREVKERTTCDEEYVKKLKKLVPASVEEYAMLQDIFAGGYTHANKLYSGRKITGEIEHYDFASSYPTVMVCEKYPMTPWRYIKVWDFPEDSYFEDGAYIFKVTFKNIKSKSFNTYIQSSKCTGSGFKYDNGRVIKADELTIWITEQDYITIRNNYIWESHEILKTFRSRKEYLPKPIVEYILELYGNKTSLKDVEGQEDIYMQSKQYINSMFGMMVTALMQSDVNFEDESWEWSIDALTVEAIESKLWALRSFNPREKRYFLSYSWGCYVTAYARRNLWRCIESCDRDVLYCDTDSIFIRKPHDFTWYNTLVTEKLRKACEAQGLDFALTRPKTKKGKEKPLGIFDREEDCVEFKTLGAKRYVERRADGKLYLTVSGINKEAVQMLNNDIDLFDDDFDFNMDSIGTDGKYYSYLDKEGIEHPAVNKRLSTYINEMPVILWPDGYRSELKAGINMRRTGYLLTITDEYKKLMQLANMTASELPDRFYNIVRGQVPRKDLDYE